MFATKLTSSGIDRSFVMMVFLELDAALPMTLHPTKHTSKYAGVHSIQNDRLKHSTKMPVNTYTWLQEARRYQPAPRPGTMPRQCLPG